MAIIKKPSKKNNELIDAIISKGGGSPITSERNENASINIKEEDANDHVKITLRLPHKMLNIIDRYLEKSISKKTRTVWLREAAEEKIDREILLK